MIRQHENKYSWKAGALAIAVHVALLGAMLFSFNWKAAHPVMNVTEVELWDKLPAPSRQVIKEPKPEPKSIVEEKLEPKPQPIVEKPDPKTEPKVAEPKVDIALEKKKKELEEKQLKKDEEKLSKEKELAAKLEEKKKLAALREEDLKADKAEEKKQNDALKKLQQEALADENAASNKQASASNAAASASIIGEYKAKIQAKIRGNVNKTLCGDGNPELRFEIGLLPTGELSGTPKLTKSSGIAACDDAVERAIAASQPLPLPSDASLFSSFRNLNLKFKPND